MICGRWAGMGSRPTWTWALTDLELSLRHLAGTFTDETHMSLAIARAILSKGRKLEGALIAEVAREFVAWSQSSENDRAPGDAVACRHEHRRAVWPRRSRRGQAGLFDPRIRSPGPGGPPLATLRPVLALGDDLRALSIPRCRAADLVTDTPDSAPGGP